MSTSQVHYGNSIHEKEIGHQLLPQDIEKTTAKKKNNEGLNVST